MANNQVSAAYHIANNPAQYELQRSNDFEFVVMGLDNLLRTDGSTINNAQEILRFSVVQTSVPHYEQEPITIRRGNAVIKAAGLPTFNSTSLVINDFIGADGKSVLMAWQSLSYNPKTQKVGRLSSYKKDCYLIEYTPGDHQIVRQWLLKGCWVKGISEPEYNQESGDKRQITANIEYDWAEMSMPD